MNKVEIREGQFYFHGEKYFLFGGEVQYFRLRDKHFDKGATWAIWEDTLDRMAAAGMNLVTVYIPWNYHEYRRDRFDFTGARDVDKFLEMCHERRFLVQAKPGPYITAEWPYGPRSFGAVPQWLLDEHPETLVLTKDGKPYSHDPLGAKWSRQCTFMHPFYLERVRKWFDAISPILLKYINDRPCIFSIQTDNETNYFWADKYLVDHNPVALRHYQNLLEDKYGDIENLNCRYGTSFHGFGGVEPPCNPPANVADDNARHMDWFEAGWAYIREYLIALRAMWEDIGLREPDVLFTTNDTHNLLPMIDWKLQWPRPLDKLPGGLPTLDSYPRCRPFSRALDDMVCMTPFTAKLLDYYGDRYPIKDGSWVMGAEMQGGIFKLPVINMKIKPEATQRMITQAFGHGVKAYATFIIREGYHLDNSIYHFQAPINYKGNKTARFDVLETAAKNIVGPVGDRLLDSVPAKAEVAVVVNPDYHVPLGGTRLSSQNIWHQSYGGVFGWLTRSGFAVDVVDIHEEEDLSRYKVLAYVDPGLIGAEDAEKLADYLEGGGSLIHMGWPAEADIDGRSSASHRRLLEWLPDRYMAKHRYEKKLVLVNKGKRYTFNAPPPIFLWEAPPDSEVYLKVDLGGAAAIEIVRGAGRAIHFPFDIGAIFNTGKIYRRSREDLAGLVQLARHTMSRVGIEPTTVCDNERIEAWTRFAPSYYAMLVFATNDGKAAKITIKPGAGWDIDPYRSYRLYAAWKGRELGPVKGAKILADGIPLEIGKQKSEIVLIEQIKHFIKN